jgi:uncharacterized iron-regulated membrane protein
MLFRSRYINGWTRDFNWHHVFSVWMLVPLLLIAFSGVVMSYPWANSMVFAAFGESVPQRGGPPGMPPGGAPGPGAAAGERPRGERPSGAERPDTAAGQPGASYAALLAVAQTRFTDWARITLPLDASGPNLRVSAELRSNAFPAPRQTLTLARADAAVVELSPLPQPGVSTQSPAQRARTWLRFVHTGEQYGITGQTLALLASLAACFLVYTGLALAWRRLIRPLLRSRSST